MLLYSNIDLFNVTDIDNAGAISEVVYNCAEVAENRKEVDGRFLPGTGSWRSWGEVDFLSSQLVLSENFLLIF